MPNDKYFGLKYEILFAGGSWRDVTSHVDSRQTKITLLGCTSDLKGGISTMDVELRYGQPKDSRASHSSLVGQLLQAKADGDTVLFRATGLTEFVGRVDMSNFSQTNSVIPGFLSMTVEDMSYLLDEKMETFEYPPNADLNDIGYVVFDPALPHISVVTQRLIAAGYELTDIDTDASDVIGERVRRVVSGDDDRTYRDFLNTLLYEYCAVLYCNGEGKFVIRRLYQESPVAGREITEFLAADGISTKGGDYQADGEEVVWSTLSVGKNAVYVANISVEYDETGPIKGEEVLPHHYWPKDGDIEETWQEFSATFLDRPYLTEQSRKQNKDLSIVSVKNVEVSKSFDVPNDFVLANNPPEIEPRRARFLYYNKSDTETRNVFGFAIEGNVLYRSKLNETLFPPTAKKPSPKYETEFVYDAISAERLANHLYRFRKNGDLSHTWAEMSTTPFPLFEVVNVAAPDTHISTLGLVLSQDITFPAPKKVRTTFTSVSITAFNSEPARVRSVVLGKVNVEPGRDGQSGDKQIVQYALGDEDAPYSDESVLLGTDDTLVGTNMALVGVDKSQVWQDSPPTPEKGQYVWRREGWYTPPSVWPNVWNIVRLTGIQGEDAEKIELRKSPENIVVTARGLLKTNEVIISAVLYNIDGTIVWSCTGGTVEEVEIDDGVYDNTTVILDGESVTGDYATVTASVTIDGVTHTAVATVDRIVVGDTSPVYMGALTDDVGIPTTMRGEPLIQGDHFLWIGSYIGDDPEHDPNNEESTEEELEAARNINAALSVEGEFIPGRMYAWNGTQWAESRDSEHLGNAYIDALNIAKESNLWFYAAVVVAQLGLFQDLLVGNTLKSVNYEENENGRPIRGFILDGPNDVIKAYAMKAYDSQFYGTVESTGFKTITGTEAKGVGAANVAKNLYKYSDMFDLVADSENFTMASGTVDGFTFDRLTRRSNARILMGSQGYESRTVKAGATVRFTPAILDTFFGKTLYYAVSGYYSGRFSSRLLTTYPDSDDPMLFHFRSFGNGAYSGSGTFTLAGDNTGLRIIHNSTALWGSQPSHIDYIKLYSNEVFTGIVLRNGNISYRVVEPKPNAYYPRAKSFSIGANTQDTLARHYVSGTDFCDLFNVLPPTADGYLNSGRIKVKTVDGNMQDEAVTRLVKDETGIDFYTGSGIVRVNKFVEGTATGVYDHLEISEAIAFQSVPDGVEVKSVLPWGTLAGNTENVAIGTIESRFEAAYLKYLDILNNLDVGGKITGATINTGYGDFEIGQNLRTTDNVAFNNITMRGSYLTKTTYKYQPAVNGTVVIDEMEKGEMRVCTFGPLGTTSGDDIEEIKLPSGGTYRVEGRYSNINTYSGGLNTYVGAIKHNYYDDDGSSHWSTNLESYSDGTSFSLLPGGTRIAWDKGSSQIDVYDAYFIIWRME